MTVTRQFIALKLLWKFPGTTIQSMSTAWSESQDLKVSPLFGTSEIYWLGVTKAFSLGVSYQLKEKRFTIDFYLGAKSFFG